MKKLSLALNAILLIAVAYLYYLHYFSASTATVKSSNVETNTDRSTVAGQHMNQIVFFNTDSLWKNYKYVQDMEDALIAEKQKLENRYNQQLKKLEEEYKEFQRKAQAMEFTMEEGKKKQQELMAKEQNIYKLEEDLNQKYAESEAKKTKEIQQEIIEYLKRYNKDKSYAFILGQTFVNIPYANEELDITSDLIKNLNEEYENKREKKDEE